jgi:hypothetical protein
MARTDDVPIRITASNYTTAENSELSQWLAKEAAGGGEVPESNESTSTASYSDLYDDPKGRKDVTNVDGRWGKKPQQTTGADPFHQNQGTYVASQEERHTVTGRALDSLPAAESNAQAVLSANFDHAKSGDFTAHSLLLQSKTKEGAAGSLSERVRRVINQF